jgi:hypothetical protein
VFTFILFVVSLATLSIAQIKRRPRVKSSHTFLTSSDDCPSDGMQNVLSPTPTFTINIKKIVSITVTKHLKTAIDPLPEILCMSNISQIMGRSNVLLV